MPNAGVGEPRRGPDHRRIELVARHLALGRDRHLAHHGQAIDVRIERAEAVRELLRQHRDDAAREVHRGAALARLEVERVVVAHVVAHVGDRDPRGDSLLRFASPSAVHRIVEVLRGLAVDGDERELPQVLSGAQIVLSHAVGRGFRLRERFARTRAAGRTCAPRSRSPCRDRRSGRAPRRRGRSAARGRWAGRRGRP